MATIDSYSETNQDSQIFIDLDVNEFIAVAQSFTGDGNTVDSCQFYLKKTGTPTGTLTAHVYAHTGTFGTSSKPTGAALATSTTVDVSTLTTSYALYTFTFNTPMTTTNGTKYCIEVDLSGGTSDKLNNFVSVGVDASSPTHGGNLSDTTDLSTWLSSSGKDVCFYVTTTAAGGGGGSGIPAPTMKPGLFWGSS